MCAFQVSNELRSLYMRMNESNRSSSMLIVRLISPLTLVSVTCLICLMYMRPLSLRTPFELGPCPMPKTSPEEPPNDAPPEAELNSLPKVLFRSSTTQMMASLNKYTKNSRTRESLLTESKSYICRGPKPERGCPFQSMMRFLKSSVMAVNGELASSSCWMTGWMAPLPPGAGPTTVLLAPEEE